MNRQLFNADVSIREMIIRNSLHGAGGAILVPLLIFAATVNLESTPPLNWDEGWTLSVARNWVERGHYGRLSAGELAPPGLEAAISVTAPIALSFYLLGIDIWQGRLIGVLFMLATLAIIYYLARLLYDQSVAAGTFAVLLLLSTHPELHLLYMGRRAWAEIPMLFYLLSGYTFFLLSQQKSMWFAPLAFALWGIALITKAQVLPFWTISLLGPLMITLIKRKWKMAAILTVGLGGSLMVFRLLIWLERLLLQGHTLPKTHLHGLYDVTALVPVMSNRLSALKIALVFGIPTLFGIFYAIWRSIKNSSQALSGELLEVVRLALLFLTGSWLAWYLLLSVGWARYLFPATFIGSIFVAVMLRDLTDNFSFLSTIRCASSALKSNLTWQNSGALLAIVLTAWSVSINTKTLYQTYFIFPDISALQVADFFNTETANSVVIETYESELHFLLKRRYHYPPDQISIDVYLRDFGKDVSIEYDPLAADPDYLVTKYLGHGSELYRSVLVTGAFRLLRTYGSYDIYHRVR